MTLLVTGAQGQIGKEICRAAAERHVACRGLSKHELDVTNPEALRRALAGVSTVVNCAAYTMVDRAEREPEKAFAVNRDGARAVAAACAAARIPLIHLSTDYVFDGRQNTPYQEDDPVSPLCVYGASKAAGEGAISGVLREHIILRTAWVFSPAGNNFVSAIVRAAQEKAVVGVVDDQFGGPTAASDIAAAVLSMYDSVQRDFNEWGVYHFCGAPGVTRYSFAAAILGKRFGTKLRPVKSATTEAAARRPAYTMLGCSRIARTFGILQPSWEEALRAMSVIPPMPQTPNGGQ